MAYFQRHFKAIIIIYYLNLCACEINKHLKHLSKDDEPLYLTPYLESGDISEARKESLVKDLPDISKVPSFSGFFTVNKTYNSNIFFWFVPAVSKKEKAPLLLWLEGGPGTSGLSGLFVEHGPYFLYPNLKTGMRKYAWTNQFHVIYVDNPVGTGFSFTESDEGYAKNQDQMAQNMYEFLQQFFVMFSEYRKNELYVTGSSYGGKYVPALSYEIHKRNNSKINFKGMTIGNGFSDPESMLPTVSTYLYYLGFVDRKQAEVIKNVTDYVVELIRKKDYSQGISEIFKIAPIVSSGNTYIEKITGYNFFFNFLFSERPKNYLYYKKYLKIPEVRKALHVGNKEFQDGSIVKKNFLNEYLQSVKPQVQVIVNNYRVLYYSGQLDLTISHMMTNNFLYSLEWKYAEEYRNAERKIWRLRNPDSIAGYYHCVKNFCEMLIRNAGHIVPHDQTRVSLELMSRFVNRKSFEN